MKRTPEPKVQPALVSRRDAAVYLGLTTRTVDSMATAGQITRIRMGGKTMFAIADLDRLIAANAVTSDKGSRNEWAKHAS